jgi:putative transposase
MGNVLTFKFRVKDATTEKWLAKQAIGCNQIWNFCVATQRETQRRRQAGLAGKWLSHFDLLKYTTGVNAELGIGDGSKTAVVAQFVASRNLHKKCPRFRSSFGAKRSLGWVPFQGRDIKINDATITFRKQVYRFWKSRDIPSGNPKAGCFIEDARGRWYVCLAVEVCDLPTGNGKVGIDLGLKTTAVVSDGTTVPALRGVRTYAAMLATAQRAGNKKRVKAIHAKVANARKHQLHVASCQIARANGLIVVGDVSSAKLVKTRMAKSVLDAGWSMFKNQLAYKARRHQAVFMVVSERMTSQTCSCCGSVPASSPKGMGALGVRHWVCSDCGSSHDRDVNAARNILRVGLERQALAGEIPVL